MPRETGKAPGVPPLHHPLPSDMDAALRQAVLQLRSCERRRVFDPVLHVGWPCGPQTSYASGSREALDHALRADLVATMLRWVDRPGAGPLVWVARTGELALHDVDAAWLAAAGQAFGEAGRPLTMVVVTRQGWWDPRSRAHRVWKRLRAR